MEFSLGGNPLRYAKVASCMGEDVSGLQDKDAAMKAGELIENLGNIWEGATLAEKHQLLTTMLDTVYVDLLTSRSIVGLLPKPAFYRLFESLKRNQGLKVIIFNPREGEGTWPHQEKENALEPSGHVLVLVEAGEAPPLSAPKILPILKKRRALVVVFQ